MAQNNSSSALTPAGLESASSAPVSLRKRKFSDLSDRYKRVVMAKVKQDIMNLFDSSRIYLASDMSRILKSSLRSIVGSSNDNKSITSARLEEVIGGQLKSLDLESRNKLIQLLTHTADQLSVNHDVLELLPCLIKRSTELLQRDNRKVREDKIDVKFVSDFMHSICRVNTFGRKIKVGSDSNGQDIFHCPHELVDKPRNIYTRLFKNSHE